MSISWLINNLIATFLLPPLNGLLMVGAGWLILKKYPRSGRLLVGTGLILLWVLAMPVVGMLMLSTLEGHAVSPQDIKQAQAIVVLGGGRYPNQPEYSGETVKESSLVRLRYAAKIQRESKLPILVTGGKPEGGELSEAELMQRVLTKEFGVPVQWIESSSNNTTENARLSSEILKTENIRSILLITHTWHMPRASRSFSRLGLTVIQAPTIFSWQPLTVIDFLPKSYAGSSIAMHEWIGLLRDSLR